MVYWKQWPSWCPQLTHFIGWLLLPVRRSRRQARWPPPPPRPPCSHLQAWGVCPNLRSPPRSWSSSSSCSASGPTPSSLHTGRAHCGRLSHFCQGLVPAALLGWGREDQYVGLHHGRGEEEEKGASGSGGTKQGGKPVSKINDLPSRIEKRVNHWKSGRLRRHLTDMKPTMATHTSPKSQSIQKFDFSTKKDLSKHGSDLIITWTSHLTSSTEEGGR